MLALLQFLGVGTLLKFWIPNFHLIDPLKEGSIIPPMMCLCFWFFGNISQKQNLICLIDFSVKAAESPNPYHDMWAALQAGLKTDAQTKHINPYEPLYISKWPCRTIWRPFAQSQVRLRDIFLEFLRALNVGPNLLEVSQASFSNF